jgi:small subunit ribosomal protein S8
MARRSLGVVSDPIADMLTRIRNAVRARQMDVRMPASKLKIEVARVLKEEGYIDTRSRSAPTGGRC